MKKRIISLFTSLLMVFSLAVVMPSIEASAVSGTTAYSSGVNPYPAWNDSAHTQRSCTSVSWECVYQNTGIRLPGWGNGGDWYSNAANQGYQTYTSTPTVGHLAVWSGGDYCPSTGRSFGHVGYIIAVNTSTGKMTVYEGGRTDISTPSIGTVTLSYVCGSKRSSGTQTLIGFINPNPVHTHNYSSSVTKQPTCIETGVRTYTCSCGSSYTETITAKGHSYVNKVVAPTSTEKGYTLHTCSVCGNSYKDSYVNPPELKEDGWYYCDVLPSDVSSDKYIIQYNNYYEKTQSTSPGSDWTNAGVVKNEWQNSGSQYTSGYDLETSDARVLISSIYYHFCGPNAGNEGNYEQSGNFVHYDWISASRVTGQYIDVDNGHPYYLCYWPDGSAVYCKTGDTCDGTWGTHGARCRAWYKENTYQDRVKVVLNKYTKNSGWVSTKDSGATKVSCRYKFKSNDISYIDISIPYASYTYTGSEIKPAVTVKMGTKTLVENTDYFVQYKNNVSAGTASIEITGKGDYKGAVSKDFVIDKADLIFYGITIPDPDIEWSVTTMKIKDKFAYTGKEISPKIIMTNNKNGLRRFVEGVDYSVSYSNNINIGTATITVKILPDGNCYVTPADYVFTKTFTIYDACENGHTFSEWSTTTPTTCTADGTQTRKCSVCGKTETKTIAKTGHKYTTKVVVPTTTSQGYTLHTCSICGNSYKDNYTAISKEASIRAESKTAKNGEIVKVNVSMANNPGFSYLKLGINYDPSVMEFVEASNGTVSIEAFTQTSKALSWDSESNSTSNGNLATLTFRILNNAKSGNYQVGVSYIACYNDNENNVDFKTVNGMITVANTVYGDVNGDGEINGKDIIRLRKYLATYDESTGESDAEVFPGADTNGDGTINGKDLIRLRKYLADYDEKTGQSSVTLGS